ncbi:MAG: hypothetical protein FH758_12920 [Firmicutes bacterium]|nr:hypothetical protein [Bacillota bacterium]
MTDQPFVKKQSIEEVIEEYGGAAYSPDFGAWAELAYEENGQEFKRTTMIVGNPQWSGALDITQGDYIWKWAYDSENDLYFLLLTWHSGLRLPIAFDKDGAGRMFGDPEANQKFDVMVVDQPVMPKNWDDGNLKFTVLWDIEFKKAEDASWPE